MDANKEGENYERISKIRGQIIIKTKAEDLRNTETREIDKDLLTNNLTIRDDTAGSWLGFGRSNSNHKTNPNVI